MLSRIAESLFWIGRYVERADDTARILDVQTQHAGRGPVGVDEDSACRALLIGDGHRPRRAPRSVRRCPRRSAFDPEDASSIAGALSRRPGERPPGPRDGLHRACGRRINTTWNCVRPVPARARPPRASAWVRERAALINGIADSTMSHDEGWQFMVLGPSPGARRHDRAAGRHRVLPPGRPPWSTMLRACGAHEAFLRTYRGLDDRRRPPSSSCWTGCSRARSSTRCRGRALPATAWTPPASGSASHDEARRLLGRARAELEYRPMTDILADLPERDGAGAAHRARPPRRGRAAGTSRSAVAIAWVGRG